MNTAVNEAVDFTNQIFAALQGTPPSGSTTATAQLAYLCGQIEAAASDNFAVANEQVLASPYWAFAVACFEAARTAAATYESMDLVRALILTLTPQTWLGVAVANFALRCTLAEQAQILAAMTFTTREQIDDYLDLINANFGDAEVVAADNMDNVVYVSLIQLHAAVANDLSTRGSALPAIVIVNIPARTPSLVLAQFLYQDPSQNDALVALNGIAHPLFCPLIIEALSLG